MPKNPIDVDGLEAQIQSLLRDHLGVDAVVAICYTSPDGQKRFALHVTQDKPACQSLIHMLWKAAEEDADSEED